MCIENEYSNHIQLHVIRKIYVLAFSVQNDCAQSAVNNLKIMYVIVIRFNYAVSFSLLVCMMHFSYFSDLSYKIFVFLFQSSVRFRRKLRLTNFNSLENYNATSCCLGFEFRMRSIENIRNSLHP